MEVFNSLSAIEELVADYNFIKDKLSTTEPSVAQNIQKHLTKMLILSCASYYENTIIKALKTYSQEHSKKYKKGPHGFDAIEKYSFFKMFDFGREKLKEARAFLSPLAYFGVDFKETLITDLVGDIEQELNMKAFQEICSMRNSLAHNDLITYADASSKSFEDIKLQHDRAISFVEFLTRRFT